MILIVTFIGAIVTATVQPPAPKVGDLITVTFPAPVTIDASPGYEIVARDGKQVVVRTFAPKPFALSGTMGNVRFRNLTIPVASVLRQGDLMVPAPLAPPREIPYPRLPFIAIAVAALLAALAWIAAWLRSRKPAVVPQPVVTPEERFRRSVLALRENPSRPLRWAALADETRAFLAATRPQLGSELTTSELVPRLDEREAVVEEILRQGDLEKFAPWGAGERDFDEVARRVMELAA